MIYTGIDVAKLNHFASVISSDGEVLVKPFKFSNDFEGFRSLSLVLDKYDREQLLVGLESTAHYGNNLVEFLVVKGYRFCVLDPIQTSAMRKGNVCLCAAERSADPGTDRFHAHDPSDPPS